MVTAGCVLHAASRGADMWWLTESLVPSVLAAALLYLLAVPLHPFSPANACIVCFADLFGFAGLDFLLYVLADSRCVLLLSLLPD
jgi:hypothetical protein